MERDEAIELAVRVGVFDSYEDGDVIVCSSNVGEFLELISLVEKETLEMAAEKCEEIAYMMGGSVGAMDCAISIRALKIDNQDQSAAANKGE